MPIDIIISLDNVTTLRGSINCSTVIRSPTVYLLSREKPLVNTTAPGSIHTYRFYFRFYFALFLCFFLFSLGKQSIRDWQPLHSVGCKLFVFVQVLVIILHWIDTLVLKTEGNTYRRCATSPFPASREHQPKASRQRGNPLHICQGSPERRSRSRRIPRAVAEEYQDKNSLPSVRLFLAPLEGLLLQ